MGLGVYIYFVVEFVRGCGVDLLEVGEVFVGGMVD